MKKLLAGLILALMLVVGIPPYAQAANDTTDARTWVLDTAGSISATPVWIQWILWTGCTTASHTIILNTASGGPTIIQDVSGEAGIDHFFPIYARYPGVYLTTIGSGKLIIRLWTDR